MTKLKDEIEIGLEFAIGLALAAVLAAIISGTSLGPDVE
jgi:hypothetical protein